MSDDAATSYIQDLVQSQRGARVTYQKNILRCSRYRTFAENLSACLEALSLITGETIEDLQSDDISLTVEAYRSS